MIRMSLPFRVAVCLMLVSTVAVAGDEEVEKPAKPIPLPLTEYGGVGRFKSWKRDVGETAETAKDVQEGETTAAEGAAAVAGNLLGVDSSYRRWAKNLGVDPYTTNEALQHVIAEVAKLDTVASVGSKFIVPNIPGTGFIRDMYALVWKLDHRELMELSVKHMLEMGADEKTVDRLVNNEAFTPSRLALLVGALDEMEAVAGRSIVIEQAVPTLDEAEGLWVLESVMMAAWYHANERPLKKFISGSGVPVAVDADGRVVVFAGSDYPHWTKQAAREVQQFVGIYADVSDQRLLLLAGSASDEFIEHLDPLGWSVRKRIRAEVLPRIPWGVQVYDAKAK